MICFSPRFFVPLVSPKLLALGKAKEKARFSFAFLSFFRNFAPLFRDGNKGIMFAICQAAAGEGPGKDSRECSRAPHFG
jgi:hypothetical protein